MLMFKLIIIFFAGILILNGLLIGMFWRRWIRFYPRKKGSCKKIIVRVERA